jgi:rhodanese-related sulfurtransferase
MDSIQLADLKNEIDLRKDILILDFRTNELFDQGFITGSIFIGEHISKYHRLLKINPEQAIYVVTDGTGDDVKTILNKLGFESVKMIKEKIDIQSLSEVRLLDLMITIDPDEFAMDLPFDEKARVIDLRSEQLFQASHIEDAENITLEEFTDIGTIAEIEEHENIYLFSNDNDTSFAGSLIKKQGLHNFRKIKGNLQDIAETNKIKIIKEKSTKD